MRNAAVVCAQGISELVERVAASLSGVRVELARVQRLVSVRLHVHHVSDDFREVVNVELMPDNYHDVMTATLQVQPYGRQCAHLAWRVPLSNSPHML